MIIGSDAHWPGFCRAVEREDLIDDERFNSTKKRVDNRKTLEPGANFINFYDEIFLSFDSERSFDQNRLYVAGGRQFTPVSNLQLGLLWQARTSEDFFRLQIFYTHNFDLREGRGR